MYIIYVLVAIVTTIVICSYINMKEGLYLGKMQTFLFLFIFVILFLAQVAMAQEKGFVTSVKLYILFAILLCAGCIDYKKKIIPNQLILFGAICWSIITIYEVLFIEHSYRILWNEMLGLVLGFGFFAIASLLSKGKIGFGDAKLLGIVGLLSGLWYTYNVLLVSLVLAAIVVVIGLLLKRIERSDEMPLGPFIALGYIFVFFYSFL